MVWSAGAKGIMAGMVTASEADHAYLEGVCLLCLSFGRLRCVSKCVFRDLAFRQAVPRGMPHAAFWSCWEWDAL